VKSFFAGPDDPEKARAPVVNVLMERGARVVVIALAAAWLAAVVRFRMSGLMEDEVVSRLIRGVLSGVVILLAADLIWHIVKGLINQRIERARIEGGDEAALARSGRLMTLLPILRNFLAVLIAGMAVMMALSALGVAIGPLIAGAGIFGVAIGFGSQSLVKDVISGVFYMTDDAFRVGEYIQSGSYKGTVESFSIRSVKLRHHRGPVFTVPFGLLGAVQNMSRDWVIDKFFISVTYDADIAKVKKLVKGVGAALLEDPEFGPQILETVKMKGVEAFTDYGIKLSFKVMTKPGFQSTIRRRAYAMIREAFAQNGIGFASPTVQVASNQEDHSTGAAIAAATDSMVRKKAADVQLKLVEGEG
ncbi:MAG: mechanosensitive ion channel family protein, partial [Phyllobacterium sp.]|uniref:mechanosensitive ion channel family protein n=1 Tax=Phyllobacterium sp. TaxID=1871046 RepID=UPI0030F26481